MAKSSKPAVKGKAISARSVTIHDQKPSRGDGGELHQVATADVPVLTTAQGGPVSDDQNSLKIGPRGPTLLEDFHFREKIFHFDHERIPERVVHARGYGAHGFFENYKPLSKYTRAGLFQRAGERTPAFVRFSTVQAQRARSIWRAMYAGLPSSFIPRKATGTSSATTFRCSSSRTRSSFRTSFMR